MILSINSNNLRHKNIIILIHKMVFETLKDFAIYDELKYLISVIFKKSIFIPLL